MTKVCKIKRCVPKRTCTVVYSDYRKYKEPLSKDFHSRCGYCDDFDFWAGGYSCYHVEHFVPKKKFSRTHPNLKTDYNNLIYACPFCNVAKREDWPSGNPTASYIGEQGYIDPCKEDYSSQFIRTESGKIMPQTPLGEYMYRKLKLYLKRHEIIWKLEEIENCIHLIELEIEKMDDSNSIKEKYLSDLNKLYRGFFQHISCLKKEVSGCYNRY